MTKAVFYQSIGPELSRYDIDAESATLTRRDAVTTPGTNVQYVWPHPSKKWLYVVSSDGGPGAIPSTRNVATAFRIDPESGALTQHGETAALPSRPVSWTARSARRSASPENSTSASSRIRC
jgi:6-phosphogluconolactonase (cycloisomerase 2 family)